MTQAVLACLDLEGVSGEKKGRNRSCRVAVDSIAYHLMQGESLIKFSTLEPSLGGGRG